MWCEVLHLLAEKSVDSFAVEQIFKKILSEYVTYHCEFMDLDKRMVPTIPVELVVQHMPTST
jgi:hypothetical protein